MRKWRAFWCPVTELVHDDPVCIFGGRKHTDVTSAVPVLLRLMGAW